MAAWKMGYTGKGIVITILDDGLEKDHPDLQANYVSITRARHIFGKCQRTLLLLLLDNDNNKSIWFYVVG